MIFVDDRGTFFNITPPDGVEFNIKRTYVCRNFAKGTIRGFHYHQHESKLFYVPQGAVKFIIWALSPKDAKDASEFPSFNRVVEVKTIILTAENPTTLHVPKGYVNGWQTLTDDAILIGCSDRTMEQSVNDDIRIDPDAEIFKEYWKVKNR